MDNLNDLIATIRKLGDSAHDRVIRYHKEAGLFDKYSNEYRELMNDYFYWSGKATAYVGIAAGMELRQVVVDELDSEGSCP